MHVQLRIYPDDKYKASGCMSNDFDVAELLDTRVSWHVDWMVAAWWTIGLHQTPVHTGILPPNLDV